MAFENLTSTGIIGLLLIVIALSVLVPVVSWTITRFTKSKKGSVITKNHHTESEVTQK
jgi:hypothetical protein